MKTALGCGAAVLYFGIGFVQLLAAIKGIQLWMGVPWLIAVVISTFVAWIPVVGTVAGIKGATDAWGWGFWPAVAFFCWPFVIYVIAIAGGGIAVLGSFLPKRRTKEE